MTAKPQRPGLFSFKGETPRLSFIATAMLWMAWTYGFGSLFLAASRAVNPGVDSGSDATWLHRVAFPTDFPNTTMIVCYAAFATAFVGLLALSARRLRDIGLPAGLVAIYLVAAISIPHPPDWPMNIPSLTTLVWEIFLALLPGRRRTGILR